MTLFASRIGLIIALLYATLSSLVFPLHPFPRLARFVFLSLFFSTLFIFPAAAATAIYTAPGARAFYMVALVSDVFFSPRPVFFVQPYRRTKYT
jgi:hypothetical protein